MGPGKNIPFIQAFSKIQQNNIGIYHDDALATFKNITGPKSDKVKKDIQEIV